MHYRLQGRVKETHAISCYILKMKELPIYNPRSGRKCTVGFAFDYGKREREKTNSFLVQFTKPTLNNSILTDGPSITCGTLLRSLAANRLPGSGAAVEGAGGCCGGAPPMKFPSYT